MDTSLREAKSLTPRIYDRVGDLFRARYGEYAGWAHRYVGLERSRGPSNGKP